MCFHIVKHRRLPLLSKSKLFQTAEMVNPIKGCHGFVTTTRLAPNLKFWNLFAENLISLIFFDLWNLNAATSDLNLEYIAGLHFPLLIYILQSLLDEWSKVLWRDVHFSVLQNEAERLQQTFHKLPEQICQMDVGRVLKTRLSEFVDSVALLKDLKHEAFKQR